MTAAASPRFDAMVDLVGKRSAFQKKRLDAYVASRDAAFFEDAERFAVRYGDFLESQGISVSEAVDAYLGLCNDMMRCQVAFMRTGRYPTASATDAARAVYDDPRRMLPYMIGLALTQFLWETHRGIFLFFVEELRARRDRIRTYLEIGPGHGLLLDRAISELPHGTRFTAVDISATSMDITNRIIRHFWAGAGAVDARVADIMAVDLPGGYDFVTMGEVLEHVDAPAPLLRKLGALLAPGGRAFVSTCANCPAVDHVYQLTASTRYAR